MKPTLQLRIGQHLTMTPQLQQAIKLLQLSTLDLKQEIQEALESNLMLETEEEGAQKESADSMPEALESAAGDSPANDINNEREIQIETATIPEELPADTSWDDLYDNITLPTTSNVNDMLAQRSADESLHDHLTWQMELTHFSPLDLRIAEPIIDSIGDDGYLHASLEDIAASVPDASPGLDEVEAVLHRIQAFDPPGVGARDPREALLIQARQLSDEYDSRELALEILEHHFKLLTEGRQEVLLRKLKVSPEELAEAVALIRSLNPHPGSAIPGPPPTYVEPDVFVFKREGRWMEELNPDASPRLRVNPTYAAMIRRADNSDDNIVLKNHLQEARWFIKSLQSRNETLLKVARAIVEHQQAFFEYGEEAMKPLVLRDIAEKVEMHESTISRVTTQKYMYTPRGTLEFKYFFSSHVSTDSGGEASATAIRAVIKKLIAAEPPGKPLSDNKIANLLAEQDIKVARRTVAKYRESMGIPPSNERKRLA
ncbi:RNA polymerase factor sigma-54 [endosymbiont of unidentified scaly snail isolate Monju]|uniref:RNA polymerase factor sigma-54 n=1 Tax=endosymbiont of unidentified scaly snail isolate Monju TaxID=1248727 RepID=UPI0003891F78|nr:RNA polymerase factor sigma-54 [endosymbiont of unidentified scaly snail isolate Monju]BAN70088.1 RNA polymerase sigma-54 factor [endosymbiont of unidentified scaly snail isolate Monju]